MTDTTNDRAAFTVPPAVIIRLRRAIEDVRQDRGMRAGPPTVAVDLSTLSHLLDNIELRAPNTPACAPEMTVELTADLVWLHECEQECINDAKRVDVGGRFPESAIEWRDRLLESAARYARLADVVKAALHSAASRAAVEVGEDAGWMVIHRVDSGPYKLYMGTRDEMLVLYERLATQWTQVILVRVMVPDANSVECGEARRLFNNLVRSPHPTDVMVERAAEAIWDAFMVNVAWDLGDSIAHDSYRDLARAALSAALTPLGETK